MSELNLFVTISQSLCTRDFASSVLYIISTSSSLQEIKKYFVCLLLWQTQPKQRLGKWNKNQVFKRAYCRINLSKANLLDGQLQTSVPLSLKKKQTNLTTVLAPCTLIFCGKSDKLIQYSMVSFNIALSRIASNVSEFYKNNQFVEFIGSEVNLLGSYLPVQWNDVKYIISTTTVQIWISCIFTSYHCTGRYELNKLTSLPMCSFTSQLVKHRTGIAEVTGSNPIEALIFFRLLPSNCLKLIVKFTAIITLHFHLQPQYKYGFHLYFTLFAYCYKLWVNNVQKLQKKKTAIRVTVQKILEGGITPN